MFGLKRGASDVVARPAATAPEVSAAERRWADMRRAVEEENAKRLLVRDEELARELARHERDKKDYVLECDAGKFGAFLTVLVSRRQWGWTGEDGGVSRQTVSLNLAETQRVVFVEGGEPDLQGRLIYEFFSGRTLPSAKTCPDPNLGRPYRAAKEDTLNFGGSWGIETMDSGLAWVRSARDDEISFVGIDTAICVPAGLGRAVFDQIMAELNSVDRPLKN